MNTDALIQQAMEAKGLACQAGDDMMHIMLANSPTTPSIMVPWTYETTMLRDVCLMLRRDNSTFTEAAFISDAYGVTLPKLGDGEDTERPSLPRHSLGERFAKGDPEVYECLNVIVVRRDRSVGIAQCRYVMVDGYPVYDEPNWDMEGEDATTQGIVPDALWQLVRENDPCLTPNCNEDATMDVHGTKLCTPHGYSFMAFLKENKIDLDIS